MTRTWRGRVKGKKDVDSDGEGRGDEDGECLARAKTRWDGEWVSGWVCGLLGLRGCGCWIEWVVECMCVLVCWLVVVFDAP